MEPVTLHSVILSLTKAQLDQERDADRLRRIIKSQAEQIATLSKQHTEDQRHLRELADEISEIGQLHRDHYESAEGQLRHLLSENDQLKREVTSLRDQALLHRISSRSPRRTPSASPSQATIQRRRSAASSSSSPALRPEPNDLVGGEGELGFAARAPDGGDGAEKELSLIEAGPSDGGPGALPQIGRQVESDSGSDLGGDTSDADEADDVTLQLALATHQLRDAQFEIGELRVRLATVEALNATLTEAARRSNDAEHNAAKLSDALVLCDERSREVDQLKRQLLDAEAQLKVVQGSRGSVGGATAELFAVRQQLRDSEVRRGQLEFELAVVRREYDQWRAAIGPGSARFQCKNAICGPDAPREALDDGGGRGRQGDGSAATASTAEIVAAVEAACREERERAAAALAACRAEEAEKIARLEVAARAIDVRHAEAHNAVRSLSAQLAAATATSRRHEDALASERRRRDTEVTALREELRTTRVALVRAEAEAKAAAELASAAAANAEECRRAERDATALELSLLRAKVAETGLPQKQSLAELHAARAEAGALRDAVRARDEQLSVLRAQLASAVDEGSRQRRSVGDASSTIDGLKCRLTAAENELAAAEETRRKQVLALSAELRRMGDARASSEYQHERSVVPAAAYRELELDLRRSRQFIDDAALVTELVLREASAAPASGAPPPAGSSGANDSTDPAAATPLAGTLNAVSPSTGVGSASVFTPPPPLGAMRSGAWSDAGTPLSAQAIMMEKSTPIAGQRLVQLAKEALNSIRGSRGRSVVFLSPPNADANTLRRLAVRLSEASDAAANDDVVESSSRVPRAKEASAAPAAHAAPEERQLRFDDDAASPSTAPQAAASVEAPNGST